MSDTSGVPALPGPTEGAAPGSTRPTTGRSFTPRRIGSYRPGGLTEADALARMAERRQARTEARGPTPAAPLAARPPGPALPPVATPEPAFSPLSGDLFLPQTAPPLEQTPTGYMPPAGQPSDGHPLAPQAPLAQGDPVFDLTFGGQPARVPLSELVRGYMRYQDYTLKTQENAGQLRQAQEAHAAFTKARETLEARLPAILRGLAGEFDQPVDWDALSKADPIGYVQKDARFKGYQMAQQEAHNLAQVRANEDHLRKVEMRRLGNEFLASVLPGWRDPAIRAQIQLAQKAHLAECGYQPAEIEATEILDPRQVVILEESRRFRALVRADPSLLQRGATNVRPRPTPPGQQTMQGNGQLRREPAQQLQAADAQKRWDEMATHSGAGAREAAVALIGARRRNANLLRSGMPPV